MTQFTTLSDLIEAAQLLPCPIKRYQRDHQLISKYLETLNPDDYPRDPDNPSLNLAEYQEIVTLQSAKRLRFVIYFANGLTPTWMFVGKNSYVHIEASDIKGVEK